MRPRECRCSARWTSICGGSASEGSSERTPFLVLSGVHLTVAAVAAAVIALAFLVYWLA